MSKHSIATAVRALCVGMVVLLSGCSTEVLSPKGAIGAQEKTLILVALGLMLLVVVPVIVLTLVFAWRYRSTNTKATYAPKWAHSNLIEAVVWTVPCIIVAILAVLAWRTSHTLDPYRPLVSKAKPSTVEVVAMDWKWLFIYPKYKVASVNEMAMPVNVPVDFRITSDTVMNSFFIPQLGSQIYAMSGMETQLHLIANEPGTYAGISANFSGPGFSDMHFKAIATSTQGFNQWIAHAKASSLDLTWPAYADLAKPSKRNPVVFYAHVTPNLFGMVVNKYMAGPNALTAHGGKKITAKPMQHIEAKNAE